VRLNSWPRHGRDRPLSSFGRGRAIAYGDIQAANSMRSPPPAGVPHAACGVGWPWGGARGGGVLGSKENEERAPTPNPSPHSQRKHAARGGGEHGESAAPSSLICNSPAALVARFAPTSSKPRQQSKHQRQDDSQNKRERQGRGERRTTVCASIAACGSLPRAREFERHGGLFGAMGSHDAHCARRGCQDADRA
jgi:hypothetical protein